MNSLVDKLDRKVRNLTAEELANFDLEISNQGLTDVILACWDDMRIDLDLEPEDVTRDRFIEIAAAQIEHHLQSLGGINMTTGEGIADDGEYGAAVGNKAAAVQKSEIDLQGSMQNLFGLAFDSVESWAAAERPPGSLKRDFSRTM